MAFVLADRVKQKTVTTGTGSINILDTSTVVGFQKFNDVLSTGDTTHYCITNGTYWEVGLGTYTNGAAAVLTRDTVLDSSTGSKLNLAAGSKNVFITTAASYLTGHISSTSNPHSVTKAQVGLTNVDDTSDADKPVSTATQTALDAKADSSHTHTESDITDLDHYDDTDFDARLATKTTDDIAVSATNLYLTNAEQAKLSNIAITQAVDLDTIEARVNALDSAVVLKGEWDASAGTFPGSGSAQAGESYIVSAPGTVDGVAFVANDRIVAILDNASASTYAANWLKLDYTDQVLSVDGLTGAVSLSTVYQPLNTKLTTLANHSTDGLIVWDSSAYTARTITGTTNLITVTNGNGVSGNPTITVGANVITTTGTQTLTNKTIDAGSNTITNIGSSEITADIVTGLTEEASPANGDFVLGYDTTAGELRKFDLQNLPGGGGGGGVSDLQGAFDGGQTITIADTDNQTLTINQNDTTNNPTAVKIANTGTGKGLLISMEGAPATNQYGLDVLVLSPLAGGARGAARFYSNEADTAGTLLEVVQDNASSVLNELVHIQADGTTSNGGAFRLSNNGTTTGMYISQDGVLSGTRYALQIYSNTAQTTSSAYLFYANQDNAGSSSGVTHLKNDGTGTALFIDQNGNGKSIFIDSEATSFNVVDINAVNTSSNVVDINNNAASSTSKVLNVTQDHASATGAALAVKQDGTGYGLDLDYNGATGTSARISSTTSGTVLQVVAQSSLSGGALAFQMVTSAAQTHSGALGSFQYSNSSSTARLLQLLNSGSGTGLYIDQNGNGAALYIDSEATTSDGIELHADALTTGSAIYIDANTSSYTGTSGLIYVNQDHASATGVGAKIKQDGTGDGLMIDHNGDTGIGINIDRDGSDAGDVIGMKITVDNAGAGNPIGIDFSGMAVDEPVIKATADSITTSGMASQQIPVDVGGTTYYLVAYTHGT